MTIEDTCVYKHLHIIDVIDSQNSLFEITLVLLSILDKGYESCFW